ncbi:MAG: AAA family ATPase [Veillonella sp.]|nr:AAA family ATPase [Veillonella sp.]
MNYEQRISREKELTVSKIIEISSELLPPHLRERPWVNLFHGTSLLSTDEQLCRYMLAYGDMHEVKCRASFQNFPFDKLISNIEIVDWGCGQGLATCVTLDILKEHGISDQIKKITLIEPSVAALARAKANVSHMIGGTAAIHTINKYLPGYTDELDYVISYHPEMPHVIHLFSNILDIPSVNIEKLSQMLVETGRSNFVLCMGPLNPNEWRLKTFAEYFKGAKLFSDISSSTYGFTPRTLHSFSCRTQCFEFSPSTTQLSDINEINLKDKEIDNEYIDDYSPVTKRFADTTDFSKDLLNAYETIYKQLNPTDILLLRPNINADTPDIVLFRHNVGIIIFDVNESPIPMDVLAKSAQKNLSDAERKIINEKLSNTQKNLLLKVKSYERRLIDLHIESLREKIFDNIDFLKIIRKVVIFTKNSTQEISNFFNGVSLKERYYTDLISIKDLNDVISKLNLKVRCTEFTDDIANSFKKVLTSPWHSHKDGKPVTLTKDQRRLAKSTQKVHYKIISCAGSGKTEVLAHRAVDANVRTGKPVLILTYNIALRNYIRFRLSQVAADFNWNSFIILNYHEFFNSQALNCDIPVHDLNAYQDYEYFKHRPTTRYASIFIDEAQDYESSWLTILYKYFLEKDGEMVLFADDSQNIYHRDLNKDTKEIKFEGKILRKGASSECRFTNDAIFNLIQRFAVEFKLGINETQTLGLFGDKGIIKYAFIDSNQYNYETYGRWVDNTIKKYGLLRDNCAVIAMTQDLLQAIDLSYRKITNTTTVTTFPNFEQFNKIKTMKASAFAAQEKSLERTKKLHFSMANKGLKLSTVYSFKGWEAESIMLFIQKEEPANAKHDTKKTKQIEEAPQRALCPEAIYTALSRAKVNLFIFNLGNNEYDKFFKNQITN